LDPAVSVPRARGANPAEMPTAEPEDEPPHSCRVVSHVQKSRDPQTDANPNRIGLLSDDVWSYADRVCPPYEDQPGLMSSALGEISF
jgi:hypothetical protein